MTQLPLPPAAGLVQVIDGAPYDSFPDGPLARIEWAFGAPLRGHKSAKVVLVYLAFRAHGRDRVAWPALPTIAEACNLDRATVRRSIAWLVNAGWLAKQNRPRDTSRYWPKSPADTLCEACHAVVAPPGHTCQACGHVRQDYPLLAIAKV